MSKTLVIYYSLSGVTKAMAEQVSEAAGADLLELRTKDALPSGKFKQIFWGGKQIVTGEKPELLPCDKKWQDYDQLIICSPVWVGTYVPAWKTYLESEKINGKKIALLATCDGGPGKVIQNFKTALSGNEINSELVLVKPLKDRESSLNKVGQWAKSAIVE